MKFSLSLLLGVLASTAAATYSITGPELITQAFTTFGAKNWDAYNKLWADDAVVIYNPYSIPWKLEGYNKIGQNGFSVDAFVKAHDELEFFDLTPDIFETPGAEGSGSFAYWVAYRYEGQRYRSRIFIDYRFNEEGKFTFLEHYEGKMEKIDATSVFKTMMNHYVTKRVDLFMAHLDENIKIHTVYTGLLEGASGTFHGLKGLAECGAHQRKFFETTGNSLLINNCILSQDDKVTVCDQTWPYTLLADGSERVTTMRMIIKVNDLGKIYHLEGHIISDFKTAEGNTKEL